MPAGTSPARAIREIAAQGRTGAQLFASCGRLTRFPNASALPSRCSLQVISGRLQQRRGDIFTIVLRMLGVFREYRTALLTVSLLIALYKCIELMIPVLAARVINALEAHRPTSEIWVMAVTTFVVWVVHGNLLAYLVDRIEVKCFSFPAGVVIYGPARNVKGS